MFSPDSERVAYGVRRGKVWSVVVDGQEGPGYGAISNLIFSPDSKRVSYAVATRERWTVIIDGQVYVNNVGTPLVDVSTDPSLLIGHGWNSSVMSEFHMFHHEMAWSPEVRFSPDSKHVAYTAQMGESWKTLCSVVVDGQEGPGFARVWNPVFSPDGKHLAYLADTHAKLLSLKPSRAMVLDGHAGSEYTGILGVSQEFDPDGAMEFLAVKGGGGLFKEMSLYRVRYIPTP
jgi:roadblock/LC7 domain-containing protein